MSTPHFTFVILPMDSTQPLRETSLPTAPMESDALKSYVSEYFADEERRASPSAVATLVSAREAEARAAYERAGVPVNAAALDAAERARRLVEITLLTTPRAPDFLSVSLYSDPDARAKGHSVNARASALAVAAGHAAGAAVYGDAFLGRCADNDGDVWERRSISVAEAEPGAAWLARGGVRGVKGALSSSDMLAQLQRSGAPGAGGAVLSAGDAAPAAPTSSGGAAWKRSDVEKQNSYSWRRVAPGEIELSQPVPTGTRTRDVIVTLKKNRLGVEVKNAAEALPGPIGEAGGGKLTGIIDCEMSSWQLEKSAILFSLIINDTGLGETSSFAWPRVFESEL